MTDEVTKFEYQICVDNRQSMNAQIKFLPVILPVFIVDQSLWTELRVERLPWCIKYLEDYIVVSILAISENTI